MEIKFHLVSRFLKIFFSFIGLEFDLRVKTIIFMAFNYFLVLRFVSWSGILDLYVRNT